MSPKPSPSSIIVPAGRSRITGDHIELSITGLSRPSRNAKTGPVVQVSVIRARGNPSRDILTRRDRAVCGDCPLRGASRRERVCYAVFAAWTIGLHIASYTRVSLASATSLVRGKHLRLGAYGDPAAVDFAVWRSLTSVAASWTGYTHQWRTCDPMFRKLLMASVESVAAARAAQALGWRTFRIREPAGRIARNEILCPAEANAATCLKCGLCSGTSRKGPNIVITVHGSGARWFGGGR